MISNLAYIHPDAKLGQGVVVEPFAYVAGDVEIGEGTWLGPHAVVLDGARVGRDCKIHTGAVVSGVPQDLKFRGEYTTAIVGDRTVLRESVTVNRGTASRGTTIVGSDCLLMAYVHIGHDCIVGNHVVLANEVSVAGEVEIEDWAIIGGMTGIHQFTRIGAHSMTGAMSRLNKDVPPFAKAGHEPISFVGINAIGLRRRGFTTEQIGHIQDIHRILFQSDLSVSSAVARIEREVPQSEDRDHILKFIQGSKRGLIKSFNSNRSTDIEI